MTMPPAVQTPVHVYLHALADVQQQCGAANKVDRSAWRFPSFEAMVLALGRTWETHPRLPRTWVYGEPKMCFMNAMRLALDTPRLTYVEGWANRVIPIHHAWCVDAKGRIVDPTWKPEKALGPVTYVGVPIQHSYLSITMARSKMWGIFYCDLEILTDPVSRYLAHVPGDAAPAIA